MKRCPSCAEDIQDAAIRCRYCGIDLSNGPSAVPSAGETGQSRFPTEVSVLSKEGQRYALGYTTEVYAIWDRYAPGQPVTSFPKSDEGWQAAWTQFNAREAGAASPTSVVIAAGGSDRESNGSATTGGICGIVGFVLGWIPILGIVVGFVLGVLAIVFGAIGVSRAGGTGVGKGMATTGLVLGILIVVLKLIPGINLL